MDEDEEDDDGDEDEDEEVYNIENYVDNDEHQLAHECEHHEPADPNSDELQQHKSTDADADDTEPLMADTEKDELKIIVKTKAKGRTKCKHSSCSKSNKYDAYDTRT